MKDENDWQRFLNTGSIEAYLSYRYASAACLPAGGKKNAEQSMSNMGDSPYAGISHSNRNGFENLAGRGI